MEILTLTAPPPQPPQHTTWRVSRLSLDWDNAHISIILVGNNSEALSHTYSGEEATTQMILLNKANLSSNSLHKRILNKLISDGVISGTVSGSPD